MLLVYGKEKGAKKFSPMDLNRGTFVSKLVYATMVDPSKRDQLQIEVDCLNKNNPDYIFEIRERN